MRSDQQGAPNRNVTRIRPSTAVFKTTAIDHSAVPPHPESGLISGVFGGRQRNPGHVSAIDRSAIPPHRTSGLNSPVFARIENESRDSGVVGTSGPLDSEFVEMAFLSRNANLKPGQNVRTSGEGGIFPKDIVIGRIVDVRPVEYGLAMAARVKLMADLNALEEVWVLFP